MDAVPAHLAKKWEAITRMNVALMRLAHVSYFPRTMTIADGLVLRATMQHAFLWELEGKPATASKLSRALGLSHPTARRKLAELVAHGYLTKRGRHYVCADAMQRVQGGQSLYDRYTSVIAHTCKQLEKSDH